MKLLKWLLGILTFITGYLAVVVLSPLVKATPQPIKKSLEDQSIPNQREDFNVEVDGTNVSGWFYKAEGTEPLPCIILSHGFSGTKDALLEQYALKFNANGYHCITYDYRHYGTSGGEPRQLYCGVYQVEDLKAMVNDASARECIQSDAIILWGTSAGAGYGFEVASENKAIAGVIGQCGAYDHKEDSKLYTERVGYGFFLKLFVHAQKDKGRSRLGLSPHTFAAYGQPGTIAMINSPGAFDEVEELFKTSESFQNTTCARLAFMPHAMSPMDAAPDIKCPVLIQVCTEDNLVSPNSHLRLADLLKDKATVIEYPINHFDIYSGKNYDKATEDQIAFINRCLDSH